MNVLKYWSYDILSMCKRISSIFYIFPVFFNLFCWQIWNFWNINKYRNFGKSTKKIPTNLKSEKSRTFLRNKTENLKNLVNLWRKSQNLEFFWKQIWESKIDAFSQIEISVFFLIDNLFFKISSNNYLDDSFMSILHFCGSQISDLPPNSQISFIFQTCFLDFSLSLQYFFTRIGAKDSALKHTIITFLGFSNGILVADKFHFYCSKLV